MTAEPIEIIKIFCCYAPEDKILLDELLAHLSLLERLGRINLGYDQKIAPGAVWEMEIADQLNTAEVILLLISADFVKSNFCYDIEMYYALKRQKQGNARVVPILVRPLDHTNAPFSIFQLLPFGGKAVTLWGNRDEAWVHVVRGIRGAIDELRFVPAKREQAFPLVGYFRRYRSFESFSNDTVCMQPVGPGNKMQPVGPGNHFSDEGFAKGLNPFVDNTVPFIERLLQMFRIRRAPLTGSTAVRRALLTGPTPVRRAPLTGPTPVSRGEECLRCLTQ